MKSSDEFWEEFQKRVKEYLDRHYRPANEILLDDTDLRELLKISRRTSLEYRKRKIYPSYKIDGKIFYFLGEIINGIKKNGGNYDS